MNYIDWDDAIRSRPDVKDLIHQSLADLKRREIVPWVNTDSIWKAHQRKRQNLARELMLLSALEIFVDANHSLA